MCLIEFKNVNKSFKIYHNKSYSIKEKFINAILSRSKEKVEKYQVLKNVSFKIKKGQVIGIIGENGTGKSTTLKLISKILYPDSGEIIVKGKVSSLLEIGAGFQPDLTGRENVYLYGSILGISKEEIDKRYNEIIEFAEIEKFMDTAVKNYSSGMYMRLAFAVAVNVDPDILVIDEVLAVGDEAFQKKCMNKILSFKERGKTIVFVSHDMSSVRKICDRVFFIKRGGYLLEGTPEQMIGLYLKLVYSNSEDKKELEEEIEKGKKISFKNKINHNVTLHQAPKYVNDESTYHGNKNLEITKLYFSDKNGHIKNIFETNEDIKINVEFKVNKKTNSAVFGFAIYTEEDVHLSGPNSKQDGLIITDLKENNMFSVTIKNNPFLKDKYYLTAALFDESCQMPFDFREKHYWFQIVESNIIEYGKIRLKCEWNI
ncbi:ABC transporter ATP-binding protein [Clostridiaceae bacterium 35-E11]